MGAETADSLLPMNWKSPKLEKRAFNLLSKQDIFYGTVNRVNERMDDTSLTPRGIGNFAVGFAQYGACLVLGSKVFVADKMFIRSAKRELHALTADDSNGYARLISDSLALPTGEVLKTEDLAHKILVSNGPPIETS